MEEITSYMIGKVHFTFFSPEMIRSMSALKVTEPDTYSDDGYPLDGGLVDPRLGVIDPGLRCKTCGGRAKECPGHFGHIDLVRPVVHSEFAKIIDYVLKSSCEHCHRVFIEKEIPNEDVDEMDFDDIMKIKKKEASKVKTCPYCKEPLGEKKYEKPTTFRLNKKILLPTEIREWLASIPDEDIEKLGLDPKFARPEWLILTVLPVPPVNVRPSITLESGERSEDDLTHKIVDIMRTNQRLEANINAGAPQLIIEDLWELLQYHITTYFNNETANIPPARHRSGRPLKTLSQRLKGKEGRFRYNLSGKRVNFSARTVISPDPRISLDEVGVPQEIAENMTVQMKVTPWNMDRAEKLIRSKTYPRAIYLILKDGKRIKVEDALDIDEVVKLLSPGCTVERTLVNGDIVIFNRQPSLHRISMLAHQVRVLPGKTFRLNPIVCPPYNADFDGDEMNLHVLQTLESQVEAEYLMKVHNQIISPRHGHAIIKPQEDHISGIYFLSRDDAIFTKKQACNLLSMAGIHELPKPDKKDKYSGKLLISLLLPEELDYVNEHPKMETPIIIKKGKMISGSFDNKSFNEVLEIIFFLKGGEYTKNFLDSLTKMGLAVLTETGLSVSLKEYSPSQTARAKIDDLTDKAIREIEGYIAKFKNKTLERQPGLTLRETLEEHIMKITSKVSKETGKILESDLGLENPSIIMAKIGARGSILNVIQMCGLVGQQAVRSKRLNRGYDRRTLLQYEKGDLGAVPHGFIKSNFVKGLRPEEFFLASMGGRESLVNTAIRTARSGYMQRRLVNALQDVVVKQDLTVRDSSGAIIQFKYGVDGLDPMNARVKDLFE